MPDAGKIDQALYWFHIGTKFYVLQPENPHGQATNHNQTEQI